MGKTWLLLRWAGVAGKLSTFGSSMPTIGIDFKMKTVVVHGRRMKVQVVRSIISPEETVSCSFTTLSSLVFLVILY